MIAAKQWYHLFNHHDPAFTAEIQELGVANFLEVVTDSPAGHSATAQGAIGLGANEVNDRAGRIHEDVLRT